VKILLLRIAVLMLAAIAVSDAGAQYPSRPIKIVVPLPPGGGNDVVARVVGQRLSELVGQPVVVENHAGANGNIGGQMVAQAAPDGHTLLLCTDSLIVTNPSLYKNMPFDPLRDLAPITPTTLNQFILSVHPSVPAKTLPEFVDYARRASPALAYASSGLGSQHHLFMEMLKARAGIDLLHVPFRGGAPAVTATVQGTTMAVMSGSPNAPLIRAGKLRAIASTGPQRTKNFPDVPTIGEFYPGYEGTIWTGLFVPAGTPPAIVAQLSSDMSKVLADPEVKQKLDAAGGLETYSLTPTAFADLIRRDTQRYANVIRTLGIALD
jgi:tripartite-type tricarboxylate transporter receptor subunit TctC